MSKYLSLLFMLFVAVCVSSCGTKYARPDRCCCNPSDSMAKMVAVGEPAPEPKKEVLAQPEPEPEPEPEQVQTIKEVINEAIKEEKKEIKIDFEKLAKKSLFAFDSDKVSESSYSGLNFVANFLKENPNVTVKIEGHTDNIGPEEYNQDLSERRALSVANYLIDQGVDSDRITTKGFGSTRPIASNKTSKGRAKNRRTELTFRIQQDMPSND